WERSVYEWRASEERYRSTVRTQEISASFHKNDFSFAVTVLKYFWNNLLLWKKYFKLTIAFYIRLNLRKN
ncbi:hypothetical protein C0J52_14540, partial [Blattella germanica]